MTEPAEYQPEQRTPLTDIPPALVHLRAVAEEMREKLDACHTHGDVPKVEAVHHLRTSTRRVEATLETLAREAGGRGLDAATEQARQRWLRQLKKVRRAAGTVRDLDVHSELLAENFLQTADAAHDATAESLAKATAGASADPEATSLIDQASTLLAWLVDRRSEAADALCATLDGHRSRLSDAEEQFMAACTKRPLRMRGLDRTPARMALEDYLRLMDAMPLLDASNLHDFRKGAKKARYVAEAGGDDPAAVAMVKAIKRVQDAIGDWHDWEVLAEEAREALGSTGIALEEDIDGRVKHAYQRALRIASTVARRFVGEWQASRSRPSRAASRNSK